MKLEIGNPAPLFSLPSDEGEEISLVELKGKNVVFVLTSPVSEVTFFSNIRPQTNLLILTIVSGIKGRVYEMI